MDRQPGRPPLLPLLDRHDDPGRRVVQSLDDLVSAERSRPPGVRRGHWNPTESQWAFLPDTRGRITMHGAFGR